AARLQEITLHVDHDHGRAFGIDCDSLGFSIDERSHQDLSRGKRAIHPIGREGTKWEFRTFFAFVNCARISLFFAESVDRARCYRSHPAHRKRSLAQPRRGACVGLPAAKSSTPASLSADSRFGPHVAISHVERGSAR